jgi:glutaredoxin
MYIDKMNSLQATAIRVTFALSAGLLAGSLQAQTVYRIVGPDGKISFSDQPPISTASQATNAKTGATVVGRNNPALSYELQQVVNKYPVTLYTSADCGPCNAGRNLLMQRGVPFTERTISTELDGAALKQRAGETTLPFATIGQQQLKGFSDAEWVQYLEAAGYVVGNKLPAGYRNPEPAPLVAISKTPVAAEGDSTKAAADKAEKAQAARAARAQRATPPDTTSNPAGIRF